MSDRAVHFKERDTDMRLDVEAVPVLRNRKLDYSGITAHFRLRNDDGSVGSIVLKRKQLLKLRDWITDLEMYG